MWVLKSKSFGSLGGYVSATNEMIDYFRNYAKSAIYSTALPPSIVASSNVSCEIIRKKRLGNKLLENANYFLDFIHKNIDPNLISIFPKKAESAIIPIIIGDDEEVVKISKVLEKQGLFVSAIRYPTVQKGTARLRVTFSYHHSKSEIDKLAKAMIKALSDKEAQQQVKEELEKVNNKAIENEEIV